MHVRSAIGHKIYLYDKVYFDDKYWTSLGPGRNNDPTINNANNNKMMRIGSNGGLGFWGTAGVEANDNPQLAVKANEVSTTVPMSLLFDNHVNLFLGYAVNHDDGWIGTYSNHGLHLGTNNGSALFISADRNLYVDLSHDDVSKIRAELKNKYRLFVKKGILSEDYAIAPNSSWSDFVFSKDYSLPTIYEVADFIQDNNHLSNIEMQTLQEVMHSNVDNMSYCDKRSMKMDISLSKKKNILNAGGNRENTLSEGEENGKKYNRVFARIFEITSIVTEIKSILQELSMRRLFLILDDYSEIEQTSLVMFCDLIVNTLHNNSDNFVKLKISAYPGRVELGELDRQKVDIRYLDYFQLYAGDKRNEMESMAVAYTERLMDTRLKIYTGKDFDYYFDTTKTSKEEYCKYLFNMTMNVVRHIGLILDYAQELSIIQGERITLNILNEESKRFYKERLVQFFEESKTAKMTYNERIESLELNKLLNQIIDKEKTIKTNIRTNQYTAVIFQKERNNPYTSHFYIAQELEPYLGSLELNFFISKYNEMSNKSGKKVSIYALNYGLCMDENLRWGKPKGNEYRTYFIESPFNFTPVIKNFLSENKKIYCENCMHEFSEEEYNLMKKYGGTCLKCGCKNSIQEKRVLSDEERSEIEEIEKKDNLLEREQYQLLKLLQYSRKDKTATELAQELDVSWQKIGWIAKKIEEDYCYLKKEPRKGKMYYVLSDLGREYLDSITP